MSAKPSGATVPIKSPQDPTGVYFYDPKADKIYKRTESQGNNYFVTWTEIGGSKKEDLKKANNSVVAPAQVSAAQEIAAAGGQVTKITLTGLSGEARPSGALSYPHDRGGISADADYVLFKFYKYQPPFGGQRKPIKEGIYSYNQSEDYTTAKGTVPIIMYMPEDISTGFRAGWTAKSMANTTAQAVRALGSEGVGSKLQGLANTGKNFLETGGALAGAAMVQSIAQAVSGDSLSYDDIFGGISGSVFNPNTELLFNNIDLRNFSLNFKMVPKSTTEAAQVSAIIKQFKKAMLPSKDPGSVMGYNKAANNKGIQLGFIGVPNLCRVCFMRRGEEHPHLPRFKMCAIISVDVNYTPDGAYATYTDGYPVATTLTLNFQETKICFAEDIELGNVR